MAVVTFLQTTNMAAWADFTQGGSEGTLTEFDVVDQSAFGGWVDCLGSFTYDISAFTVTGTITDVVIDDEDAGSFPNLDVSGLS